MLRLIRFCFIVFIIVVLAGCATSRGYLNIHVPSGSLVNPNGQQVYIRVVTDNRQFEHSPSSADIPSLGFDSLMDATPEFKSRAIARKRNGYGKAMGDILLNEGQSVQKTIYIATRNALNSLGYAVVDRQEEVDPGAIVMDISIDKFWAWFAPGFWAVSLKSEITTTNTITMPGINDPIIVKAAAVNSCQMANEANWKKVFRLLIEDFIEKAKTEFKALNVGS